MQRPWTQPSTSFARTVLRVAGVAVDFNVECVEFFKLNMEKKGKRRPSGTAS
jgi:hypothetical protein